MALGLWEPVGETGTGGKAIVGSTSDNDQVLLALLAQYVSL